MATKKTAKKAPAKNASAKKAPAKKAVRAKAPPGPKGRKRHSPPKDKVG